MDKEEIIKFEDINKKFINSVSTSILPFLAKLEKLEFSKIDPTMQDKEHLRQSVELIKKYAHIEAEKINKISEKKIVKDINTEMATVVRIIAKAKRITLNANESGQIELLKGLETDCVALQTELMELEQDLEKLN